jgi:outer membrane lipoprotein SlyB
MNATPLFSRHACLLVVSMVLAACQSAPSQPQPTVRSANVPATAGGQRVCPTCGVVESIGKVKREGAPTVAGTIGGAVVGGILGSQIGGGSGKTIATGAGAVGGAIAARELEKRLAGKEVWQVIVRMSNGTMRAVQFENEPQLKVGEQVNVE